MRRKHRSSKRKDVSVEVKLARLYAAASPDDEDEASALLDSLIIMSEVLARRKADGPSDVLTKIYVWRVIASEEARSFETATPEEALALSIMNDCERLWGGR